MQKIKNVFDLKEYIGMYVALDNKDRIVAFNKEIEDLEEVIKFLNQYDKEHPIRIYLIRQPEVKKMIKELLD